jgi:hypothetical protein
MQRGFDPPEPRGTQSIAGLSLHMGGQLPIARGNVLIAGNRTISQGVLDRGRATRGAAPGAPRGPERFWSYSASAAVRKASSAGFGVPSLK